MAVFTGLKIFKNISEYRLFTSLRRPLYYNGVYGLRYGKETIIEFVSENVGRKKKVSDSCASETLSITCGS